MKKIIFFVLLILIFNSFIFAHSIMKSVDKQAEKIKIAVTILPQKYLVDKISGGEVICYALVPPGYNPGTFRLKPSQAIDLSKSKIYFRIGKVAFELSNIKKISQINKNLEIIDTSLGVNFIVAQEKCHQGHLDPHIWLSTKSLELQAKIIYKTLCRELPLKKEELKSNYINLINELKSLNQDVQKILKSLKSRTFFVYHPAWAYFARDYGLKQIALEKGGKKPSVGYLKEFIDNVKKYKAKVIFVQREFAQSSPQTVAKEAGLKVVSLSPLQYDVKDSILSAAKALLENE